MYYKSHPILKSPLRS